MPKKAYRRKYQKKNKRKALVPYVRPRAAVVGNLTHRFKRHTDQLYTISSFNSGTGTWGASTGVVSALTASATNERNFYLLGFRFEDIPNDSEFSALFRYYKITGVKLDLVFRANVENVLASDTDMLPIVSTSFAPDLRSTNAPTTMQAFRERGNMKRHYIGQKGRRVASLFIKPRVPISTLDIAGNTTEYQDYKSKWLSMTDKQIIHSGILLNIDNTGGSTGYYVDLESTFYFSCKGSQ